MTTLFEARIQAAITADRVRCAAGGWTFHPRKDGGHTVGDLIAAVMSVDNEADAIEFHASYIAWLQALPPEDCSERYTHAQVAQQNIGWCFGEGMDPERVAMWVRVCGAYHPVFGSKLPSPVDAFEAGLKAGEAMRP